MSPYADVYLLGGIFRPMLFAVLAVDNPAAMATAISKHYASDSFSLGPGQWLVVDKGTAKEIADKLGITDASVSAALVIAIGGYFGRKEANLWEWMKAKAAQGS